MPAASNPIYFAPIRTPVVDTNGLMSREWYLFFQALWQRAGGATAPGADDALVTPVGDSGSSVAVDSFAAAFGQLPQLQPLIPVDSPVGEIAELRAIVAEQAKTIQGLKQGVSL